MKRKLKIWQKVQRLLNRTAIAALVVSVVVGGGAIMTLRESVNTDGKNLGLNAAAVSEFALKNQALDSLTDLASSKATIANERLNAFAGQVSLFASYIDSLYAEPEQYGDADVLPPDAANKGILTMQRSLRDEKVILEDVHEEVMLLGNCRDVWIPVMENNTDTITNVYLGTESGVMLSLDVNSDLAATGAAEELYDYTGSVWYYSARDGEKTIFTDTYQDGYGRGLMITCAAPFHYADGTFAGTVCMDICLDNLNKVIIGMEEDSYAFVLDKDGTIIAAQDMEKETVDFVNIRQDDSNPVYEVAEEILSGEEGFSKSGEFYFAYAPISATGWTMVLRTTEKTVLAPVEQIDKIITNSTENTVHNINRTISWTLVVYIGAAAVISAVLAVCAYFFSKKLTKPLSQLKEDAEIISSGDMSHRTEVNTEDEIGDLAKEFNRMTESLQKHMKELTQVTAERERIGAELNIATEIQASMLPYIFPPYPDRSEFDIFATMTPAKEVGGDFYDFYLIDHDHLALTIADVSGKGVPAALFMAISKSLLKSCAQTGATPGQVLSTVNGQLCEGNSVGMFVTVWLGVLEISTGRMVCANAGHEYPVIRRKGGEYTLVEDKHDPMVGVLEGMPYKEYEMQLNPGDRLFVYTDGVAEATDANEELFGEERMIAALNRHPEDDCRELLTDMKKEIDAFVGEAPQFDDITMLTLEMKGE